MDGKEGGLILRVIQGSRAFGTNLAPQLAREFGLKPSDEDFVGVKVPSQRAYYGLRAISEAEAGEGDDEMVYGLKKFLKMAMGANPTVLQVLFVEPEDIVLADPVGRRLLAQRELFLSNLARKAFAGFGAHQIHLMETKPESREGRYYLVERFGWDTKAGMHTIRVLRMGIELLTEGKLLVRRPDAAELIDIRLGKYRYDEIHAEAQRLMAELETVPTALPSEPDFDRIDQLCVELHEEFYATQKGERVWTKLPA